MSMTLFSACATGGNGELPSALDPSKHTETRSELNPRSRLTDDEMANAKIEIGMMQAAELAPFEKVRINLKHATLKLGILDMPKTVKIKSKTKNALAIKHKGALSIKKIKGNGNCQPKVAISETRLTVVEATDSEIKAFNTAVTEISAQNNSMIVNPLHPTPMPSLDTTHKRSTCAYEVTLLLEKASMLDIDIAKGLVELEKWNDSIHIAMNWGEVVFTEIGTLSLECDECTVSGAGIANTFKYKLGKGNVGVEDLNASVEGSTSGDTVLMWKKIIPGSKISVVSKSGDVVVRVPERIPMALDLKVPKGEVYSRLKAHEVVMNSQELRHGIPLSIVAETGNIKIVH